MKIIDESLEKTLEALANSSSDAAGFPADHGVHNYYKRYRELSEKLIRDIHPNVSLGSTLADGGLLTDHGPEHIRTVISRAGQLLKGPGSCLLPYEIYLLLISIHFHDVANILGRNAHEKRMGEIMDQLRGFLGDSVERNCILKIAGAHGGNIDSDKDVIPRLPDVDSILNIDVRFQVLAAIVRFADELADDSLRANKTLGDLDLIPEGSQVFHKYASCLHSVMVRPEERQVELHFDVNVGDLTKVFGKQSGEEIEKVYLLDEIFIRTHKMHLERIYCNRFMYQFSDIRTIDVKVRASKVNEVIGESLPKIIYRLQESGYPNAEYEGVYSLDDSLNDWEGSGFRITGEKLSRQIGGSDNG